ncbi:MAG: multifunctional CCA addition/repair protein [Gammaproteobacteria bacterium]|nr:multifunctional CCA addition/repair protein [Gammaproteobacteria bacterium]MDH3448011.1 multifunctional CCA addition/repair protein [Gammaproteobacteria bacterium]
MKIYRVGGCVRDRLLGLPVNDIDWVVTGATATEMLALGFKSIGKDFPVFLHPESKQEYALARSERKIAPGYHGFEVSADPATTIEQDLLRRDLTINAIAEDEDGNIIDPYGGQRDIEARTLRHVSAAFIEDPVRVLRVARFAARFHRLGFTLAEDTCKLIRQMGQSGELEALVAERVWIELSRALDEADPAVFFTTLRDCDALVRLFPEIDALFGIPQTAKYHPEIDTGLHLMMALQKSAELGHDNETRFAVLMHDLGKAVTPVEILPGHNGHEARGRQLVAAFCKRWRVPKAHSTLALITTEYHTLVHRALDLRPSTLLRLMTRADSLRKPERFQKMLDACLADLRGRKNYEDAPYPQRDFLAQLAARLRDMDIAEIQQRGLDGKNLGQAIEQARLQLIKREKALFLQDPR